MSNLSGSRASRMGRFLREERIGRRRLLGGAGALGAGVAATALVGCGDDDDGEGATPTATEAAGEARDVSDHPEEFVIALQSEPSDLMPWYAGFDAMIPITSIYDSLVHVTMSDRGDGSADVEFAGRLAESWEQVDDDEFVFHMRPGVSFHNEEPWNADAALACLDTFMDADLGAQLGKSSMASRYIESAESVDETTVRMKTLYPLAARELFGFAFYFGYYAFAPGAAQDGVEGLAESPVGTGPYRFERWDRGQDIRMVRNEEYWDGPLNMARLRFVVREEATVRAQAVETGEVHFGYNIGAEQAGRLDNYVVGGGFQSSSIRLNNQKPPTDDPRVRKAINYAIDREGINQAIFMGTAQPIGFFGYQAPVPVWPYDPEQARALIQEAGAEGAELEFVYGEGRIPEDAAMVEIFQSQLQEVGLNIRLNRLEPGQFAAVSQADPDDQPELFKRTSSGGNYGELHLHINSFYACGGPETFCEPEVEDRYDFDELFFLDGDERTEWITRTISELNEEYAPRAWNLAINQVHGLAPNVRADLPLNVYVRVTNMGWA